MFYGHGLVPPHIAAGANLNFFPLGQIFRRGGAFFLRRSFRQNPLYSFAFKTYVHKLLKEGYSLEFFLEGGRSRTGKLLKPRFGLLTHVVDAVVDGHTHDLQICPAAIGYEKIIEGAAYKRELGGGSKGNESLEGLIKATQVLSSRYGRVYLNWDEPFSLRDFLEQEGVSLDDGFADEHQRRRTIKRLAYRVLSGINHSNVATSSSVVAQALLGNPRRGINRKALQARVGAIVDYLLQRQAPLASSLSRPLAVGRLKLEAARDAEENGIAASLSGIDGTSEIAVRIGECLAAVIDETTELFVNNKILTKHVYDDEIVFQLLPEHRLDLDYYMNNVVHHFARESLLAATLLRCRAEDDLFGDRLKKETLFISQLLKLEYVFEQRKDFDTQYRETVQAFEDSGLMEGDRAARVLLPSSSLSHLKLLAHLTLPVIEGYYVVARGAATLDETIREKEFVQRLQRIGDRLWREGEITYKEAVSSVTFDNALSRLEEGGLVSREIRQHGRKSVPHISPGAVAIENPEACAKLAEDLSRFLYQRS
jgi:glycerol-3-phosphate O-acyltransferase